MTLRRSLIEILDRSEGRRILGWAGTRFYQKLVKEDVSIFWDGSWFGRTRSEYISDSMSFDYYRDGLLNRRASVDELYRNARDFWFYKYTPTKGDTIVDIGAGSGHEAILFSKEVGGNGLVLSVEAHPTTFERLEKTCIYNGLVNVVRKNYAMMDKAGKIEISDADNDEANAVSRGDNNGGCLVESITLDALCKNLKIEKINFLKMNIEGAEQWAIHGMTEIIKKTEHITIACHDFLANGNGDFDQNVCTRERVCEFLKSNGFKYVIRSDDPRPYVQDHVHAWHEKTP